MSHCEERSNAALSPFEDYVASPQAVILNAAEAG